MKLEEFDFALPEELIAQYPPLKRGTSRLLVLNRKDGSILHRTFKEIIEYLHRGDILVINTTKVIPARMFGKRKITKGKMEVLLLRKLDANLWEALIRPGRKAKNGEYITFTNGIECRIEARDNNGKWKVQFFPEGISDADILSLGEVPLPPYIKRKPVESDHIRYQTVYAEKEGSVAAPTAGLHFTKNILNQIQKKGVSIVKIILHIGLGTFRTVQVDEISKHRMDSEYFEIDEKSASKINEAKEKGYKIFAVGTSTTRALESCYSNGKVIPSKQWTDKFIYPPYKFKVIDHLITNFHLPKTTLLMLVSAFATREKIFYAYKEAIDMNYKFFSYGDAMLIL